MPKFITELTRRNVFRVAAAYTVVAWVIAQAIDLAADSFEAPDWVMKITLAILIAGLPVALILSWAFELTPEGVMKSDDVPVSESITPKTGHTLNRLTTIALVFALAFIAWDKLGSDGEPAGGAQAEKSVAVLPFADLSESQDQEWFADGLTEEILNALARLPELKVTARTSSFEFKNTNIDIGEIAARLGVAHVVEGSVRRIGNNLRVTAQLIRAEDGFHLWSDTYDRNTEDLFEVQNDVAEKVAATLDVILDDEKRERMFAVGTRNVEAFEIFLRARDLHTKAHDREMVDPVSLADVNALLDEAMALDPRFSKSAILHADRFAHYLIEGYSAIVGDAEDLDSNAALEQFHHDYDIAIANAPDPVSGLVAQINKDFFASQWHRLPALTGQLSKLVGDEPIVFEGGGWLNEILLLSGESEISEIMTNNRRRADPLSQPRWLDAINLELMRDDFDAAIDLADQARSVLGATPRLREMEILVALLRGDKSSAKLLLEERSDYTGDFAYFNSLLATLRGDRDGAVRLAEELDSATEWPNYNLIIVYNTMGDQARLQTLVRRLDNMLIGPTILAIHIAAFGHALWFDLDDAPNLKKRLAEAQINPESIRDMSLR